MTLLILMLGAQPVEAFSTRLLENPPRLLENPPLLESKQQPATNKSFQAEQTDSTIKRYDLSVVYRDGKIYNPASHRFDKLRLRSYVGTGTNPANAFISPTIETTPGSTIRLELHNELPDDQSCSNHPDDENQPHCFNGTNLHTHGLWVSPAGNSDNVLLSINPGQTFEYEYSLPPDHPSGTFWYHSHRHGSTAMQVSSGMAGALIVRGDRLPTKSQHGDIDTILKQPDGSDLPEQILVLQQIHYACLNQKQQIKKKIVNDKVVAWICDSRDIGGIESYNNFGPTTWQESGRYTTINGQVLPTYQTTAGAIERWRLIHAGVENSISLQFRKRQDDSSSIDYLKASDAATYVENNCSGTPIPFHVIADDGLTRNAAWRTTLMTLQPGYRNDALVVFPEPGTYCMIDDLSGAAASPSQAKENRQLLGLVTVAPGTNVSDIPSFLASHLVAAAEQRMPNPIRDTVIRDLKNGLKFGLFTPHEEISNEEVKGHHQELAFFIDIATPKVSYEVSKKLAPTSDPKPYDSSRIDRHLTLGTADEWVLQSYLGGHPYHIHVNPFQIVKILDPNGKDLSLPNVIDSDNDPQYQALKGVWKDTLWVKNTSSTKNPFPGGVYTVVIRTRYERYIGDFVIHCHILNHEDMGMMENVSIGLP
ncbi:MAG: multicopper oxidase family protein [Cyanobacteriota bacterium]